MSYVKISDPAILDLAGIQQIINVVNQHSDYLNALINRFGTSYVPDYGADDYGANYDPSTHNLQYGQISISDSKAEKETVNGTTYYYKDYVFETDISFSETPRVVVSQDNSDGQRSGQLDIIVSVHNVSTTGFTVRAFRSGITSFKTPSGISSDILVNWIAIGRR